MGNNVNGNPFKEAAEMCGMKKGMPNEELSKRANTCIPIYWKMKKQGLDSDEIERRLEKQGFGID